MVNHVYLDTSALAKWYLNEARAQEFTDWFQTQNDVHLSSLTLTEFRCMYELGRLKIPVINLDEDQIQDELQKEPPPDWRL